MATQIALFTPTGDTVAISASTSSANAAVAVPVNSDTLAITVVGSAGVVHVKWGRTGGGALTATSADMPVPSGGRIGVQVNENVDRVAVLADASTATVYITPGVGS